MSAQTAEKNRTGTWLDGVIDHYRTSGKTVRVKIGYERQPAYLNFEDGELVDAAIPRFKVGEAKAKASASASLLRGVAAVDFARSLPRASVGEQTDEAAPRRTIAGAYPRIESFPGMPRKQIKVVADADGIKVTSTPAPPENVVAPVVSPPAPPPVPASIPEPSRRIVVTTKANPRRTRVAWIVMALVALLACGLAVTKLPQPQPSNANLNSSPEPSPSATDPQAEAQLAAPSAMAVSARPELGDEHRSRDKETTRDASRTNSKPSSRDEKAERSRERRAPEAEQRAASKPATQGQPPALAVSQASVAQPDSRPSGQRIVLIDIATDSGGRASSVRVVNPQPGGESAEAYALRTISQRRYKPNWKGQERVTINATGGRAQ